LNRKYHTEKGKFCPESLDPDFGPFPCRTIDHDSWGWDMLKKLWKNEQGQDIAEYAVMLAVILVIVVGTIRLIGSNANTVFSQAASSIQ